MQQRHKIISAVWGVLFVVTLQVFSAPEPAFRLLFPAMAVFSLLLTWYNYRYLKSIKKAAFWVAIRPLLLTLSGFGVFLLIPSAGLRGWFLIFTAIIFFLVEYSLGNFSENLLLNEVLLVAFGFSLSFTAFNQYFPSLPGLHLSLLRKLDIAWELPLQPIYLAGVFFMSFLLARSFYEFIPHPSRIKLINSLTVALFCTEGFWALTFLPFHYSVLAVLLFNLFYFCLILNYYRLFQILNFRKIQFHLALMIICSGAVLLFTPWKVTS